MATVPIDFVVITALEEERDAVLAKLSGQRRLDPDGSDSLTYYEAFVATTRSDGATYRVIATCLSRMGQLAAGATVAHAVYRWRPRHVLMVGIAGGIAGEVEIGDVIVAREVIDTTHGKVSEDADGLQWRQPRFGSHACHEALVGSASSLGVGWERSVTAGRPTPGTPRRHLGQIFSGTDVVASKALLDEYRRTWPKAIGVEIEGAAIATFLSAHADRPGFLMIRGVSDLADREKSASATTAWRGYACEVAAAYMLALLRLGPVAPPPMVEAVRDERVAPPAGEMAIARPAPTNVDAGLAVAMAGDDGLTGEYSLEIDHVRELLRTSRPHEALRSADALSARAWAGLPPRLKQRVQNYRGVAYAMLDRLTEGARLLVEAVDYDPTNQSATCGAVTGYLLQGDRENARALAQRMLQQWPHEATTYAAIADVGEDDQPFDDLAALIPEEFRSEPSVSYSLGQLARRRGLHQQAIDSLRITATTTPGAEVRIALGGALIESTLARGPGADLDREDRERLDEACTTLGKAIEILSAGDAREALVGALLSRATALDMLGRNQDALTDVDRAFALAPDEARVRRQRAMLLIEDGQRDSAIPLLVGLVSEDASPEMRILLAQCYGSTGQPQQVLGALRPLEVDDLSSTLRLAVARLSSDAALALNDPADAERICSALADNPLILEAAVLAARVARLCGEPDRAAERIGVAESLAAEASSDARRALADELLAREEWEKAATQYESLANTLVDSPLTRRLVWCHERSGNIGRVLEICRVLRETHGPIQALTTAECAVLEEIGDLPEAAMVVDAALTLWPADLELRVRKALIALRRGDEATVDAFVDSVALSDVLDARLGKQVLHLVELQGRKEFAIELAYEASRSNPNSPQLHTNLAMLMFSTDSAANTVASDRVTPGSAVRLRDASGESIWWVIDDRVDADVARRELRPSAPLASAMLGKGVGDPVDVGDGQPLIVAEILSKFVHAFRQSLSLFGAAMPEPAELKKMTIPTLADGTMDPQPILAVIEAASRRHQKVFDWYAAGRLPIGACAVMLRKSPVDLVVALAGNSTVGIRCSAGDPTEWAAAQALLVSRPRLVADVVALLTLKAVGRVSVVSAIFGQLIVAQATVDEIREAIHERTGAMARGFASVGQQGGRFVWTEIGRDDVKRSVDELKALLAWVAANADVVACRPALRRNRGWRMQQAAMIGVSFVDSALIAAAPGRVLLTDDACFRTYAGGELGAGGVWSQAVLHRCAEEGAMSQEDYSSALATLAQLGHRHVRITERTLIHVAAQNDWRPSSSFVTLAQRLGVGHSDEASAILVAAATLQLLWLERVATVRRNALAMALLNEVSAGRVAARMAQGLIKTVIGQAGFGSDIAHLIRAWYLSRMRWPGGSGASAS